MMPNTHYISNLEGFFLFYFPLCIIRGSKFFYIAFQGISVALLNCCLIMYDT